jgi:hypothetical protein
MADISCKPIQNLSEYAVTLILSQESLFNSVPLPKYLGMTACVWCKEASSHSLALDRSYGNSHAAIALNPEKNCPGTRLVGGHRLFTVNCYQNNPYVYYFEL